MKLHLPSSLRKALLACLAAIAAHALPVTVSTGSLAASGALISFLASQQSLAADEDGDDDGEGAIAPLAEGTLEWIGGTDVGAGADWFADEAWDSEYTNDGSANVSFGTEYSTTVFVNDYVNVHDMTVSGEYSFEGSGTINVGGTLALNDATVTFGVATVVQEFSHSGTVQLNLTDSLTINDNLSSISGISLVSGGKLILGNGSNSGNTGTINGGTFATTLDLNIASSSAWFIINGGTFSDIEITSGELSITGGAFSGSIIGTENSKLTVEWSGSVSIDQDVTVGRLEMRNGKTLHVAGDFSLLNSGLETAGQDATGSETLQVDGAVSLALNGDATFSGNLVTAEGQLLSLTGSGTQTLSYDTLTLASDISIGSGVTLKLSGLDATLSGDITLADGATLSFSSTGGSAGRVLVEAGNTATLSVFNFSSGSVDNSIDVGALSVASGATLKIDPGSGNGNGAVVYLTSALSGIEGELQVNNAHLNLMQGGTVNGSLVVDWGGTITLGDDLIFAEGATLRNGGVDTNTIVAAEEASAYLLLSTSGTLSFDSFVTSASSLLTEDGNVGVGIYATDTTVITDSSTIGYNVKIAGTSPESGERSVKFEGNMTFSGDLEVASGVILEFYHNTGQSHSTIQGELTVEGTLRLGNNSTVTLEKGGSINTLRLDWQRSSAGPTLYLGDTLEVGSLARQTGGSRATCAKMEGVEDDVQLIINTSANGSTPLMTFGEGIVVVKQGTAQQTFTGGLTISGELQIKEGTLQVNNDCTIASVTGTGGTLWLEGGTKTIDSLNFAGTVNAFNETLNLSLTHGGTVGNLVCAWGATVELGDDLTIKSTAKNSGLSNGTFNVASNATASLVFDTSSAGIDIHDYSWEYGSGLGLGVKGGNTLTMNAGTFSTVSVSGSSTLALGAALGADSLTFSTGSNTVALGAYTLSVGSISGVGSITVSNGGHISGLTSLSVEGGQLSITLSGFSLEDFLGGYELFQGGSFQTAWWDSINLNLGLTSLDGYQITYENGTIKLTEIVNPPTPPSTLYWAADADGTWSADETTDWASEDGGDASLAFTSGADVVFGESAANKTVTLDGELSVHNMEVEGDYTFIISNSSSTTSLNVTGALTLADGITASFNGDSALEIAALSGAGSLSLDGVETTITSTSDFTGSITVASGSLTLGSDFSGAIDIDFTGDSLTLSGNTLGSVTINGGTISGLGGSSFSSLTLNAAQPDSANLGNVTVTGNLAVNYNGYFWGGTVQVGSLSSNTTGKLRFSHLTVNNGGSINLLDMMYAGSSITIGADLEVATIYGQWDGSGNDHQRISASSGATDPVHLILTSLTRGDGTQGSAASFSDFLNLYKYRRNAQGSKGTRNNVEVETGIGFSGLDLTFSVGSATAASETWGNDFIVKSSATANGSLTINGAAGVEGAGFAMGSGKTLTVGANATLTLNALFDLGATGSLAAKEGSTIALGAIGALKLRESLSLYTLNATAGSSLLLSSFDILSASDPLISILTAASGSLTLDLTGLTLTAGDYALFGGAGDFSGLEVLLRGYGDAWLVTYDDGVLHIVANAPGSYTWEGNEEYLTWGGEGEDVVWDVESAWKNGVAVTFSGTSSSGEVEVALGADISATTMTVDGNAEYTFTGEHSLAVDTIVVDEQSTVTIADSVSFSLNQATVDGLLEVEGSVTVGEALLLEGSGSISFAGLAGSGSVLIDGTAASEQDPGLTVSLGGSFGGSIQVTSGTLMAQGQVSGGPAVTLASVTLDGEDAYLNTAGELTITALTMGSGAEVTLGADLNIATLTLSAASGNYTFFADDGAEATLTIGNALSLTNAQLAFSDMDVTLSSAFSINGEGVLQVNGDLRGTSLTLLGTTADRGDAKTLDVSGNVSLSSDFSLGAAGNNKAAASIGGSLSLSGNGNYYLIIGTSTGSKASLTVGGDLSVDSYKVVSGNSIPVHNWSVVVGYDKGAESYLSVGGDLKTAADFYVLGSTVNITKDAIIGGAAYFKNTKSVTVGGNMTVASGFTVFGLADAELDTMDYTLDITGSLTITTGSFQVCSGSYQTIGISKVHVGDDVTISAGGLAVGTSGGNASNNLTNSGSAALIIDGNLSVTGVYGSGANDFSIGVGTGSDSSLLVKGKLSADGKIVVGGTDISSGSLTVDGSVSAGSDVIVRGASSFTTGGLTSISGNLQFTASSGNSGTTSQLILKGTGTHTISGTLQGNNNFSITSNGDLNIGTFTTAFTGSQSFLRYDAENAADAITVTIGSYTAQTAERHLTFGDKVNATFNGLYSATGNANSFLTVGGIATFKAGANIGSGTLTLGNGGSVTGGFSAANGKLVLNGGTFSIDSTTATLSQLTLNGTLKLGRGSGDTANTLSIAGAGFELSANGKLAIDSTGLDASTALFAFTGEGGYTLSSLLTLDLSAWNLSAVLTGTEAQSFALFSGLTLGGDDWAHYLNITGFNVAGWDVSYEDGSLVFSRVDNLLVWRNADAGDHTWKAADDDTQDWTLGSQEVAYGEDYNGGDYSVLFGSNSAAETITVDGAVVVKDMAVEGSYVFTGSDNDTLTINGTLTIADSSTMEVQWGSLADSAQQGGVTVKGKLDAASGKLKVTTQNKAITLEQGGELGTLEYARLNLYLGGDLSIQTLTASGWLVFNSYNDAEVTVTFGNFGGINRTFEFNEGVSLQLTSSTTFTTATTLNFHGGAMTVEGDMTFTSGAKFSFDNGSSLRVKGDFSSTSGDATLTFAGAGSSVIDGTLNFSTSKKVTLQGGHSLVIKGTGESSIGILEVGSNNTASLTLDGSLAITTLNGHGNLNLTIKGAGESSIGTYTVATNNTASLTLDGSLAITAVNGQGNLNMTLNDSLTIGDLQGNGYITFSKDTTASDGVTVEVGGMNSSASKNITFNEGVTAEFTHGMTQAAYAGTLTAHENLTFSGKRVESTGAGSDGPGNGTNGTGRAFCLDANGTIDAKKDLTISGGDFRSAGTITVGGNASWSGTGAIAGGSFTVNGTLSASSAELSMSGGSVELNGGSLGTLSGTAGALTLSKGSLSIGTTTATLTSLTLGGTLTLDKGTGSTANKLTLGALSLNTGATLAIGANGLSRVSSAADNALIHFSQQVTLNSALALDLSAWTGLSSLLKGARVEFALFSGSVTDGDFDFSSFEEYLDLSRIAIDDWTVAFVDGKLVFTSTTIIPGDYTDTITWVGGSNTWSANDTDEYEWLNNGTDVTFADPHTGDTVNVLFDENVASETITVDGAVAVQNMTVAGEYEFDANATTGDSLTVGGDLTVEGNATFAVDATVTGELSGSGVITITGRTLTLNGGNSGDSFGGTVDVKGGTLAVGADLTVATLTNSGSFGDGTLTLSNGATLTVNNAVNMAGHFDFGANSDGTLKLEQGGTIAGRMDLGGSSMAIQIGADLEIGRGLRNVNTENASLTITALTDGLTLTLGTGSNSNTFSQATKTAVTVGDSTHNVDLLLKPASGQAFTQKFEGGLTLYGNLTLDGANILLKTTTNVITGTISGAGRTLTLDGSASLELRGIGSSTLGTLEAAGNTVTVYGALTVDTQLSASGATLNMGGDLTVEQLSLGGSVTFNRYAQSANDVVTVTIASFNSAASRSITFGEGVDGVFTAFTGSDFFGTLTMNGNATFNGDVNMGASGTAHGSFIFNARTDEDDEVVNTVTFNENVRVGTDSAYATVTAADGVGVSLASGKTLTVKGGSTFTVGGEFSAASATVVLANAPDGDDGTPGATSSLVLKAGGSIGTLSGTSGALTLSGGTLTIGSSTATLTELQLGGTLKFGKGSGTTANQLTLGALTLNTGATLAIDSTGLDASTALIAFSDSAYEWSGALALDLTGWTGLNSLLTDTEHGHTFALFSGLTDWTDLTLTGLSDWSYAADGGAWGVEFVDGNLVFTYTPPSYSDTITWVGGSNTWSAGDTDEGEWQNDGTDVTFADPHTGDTVNVLFDENEASETITVSGAVQVQKMTVEGTYVFTAGTGGSLAVGGDLAVNGSAEFGLGVTLTGALTGDGSLTVAEGGSLTLRSSSADFAGTLTLSRAGADTNNAAIIIDSGVSEGTAITIGGNMTLTARAAGETDSNKFPQYYIYVKGNDTVALGSATSTLNMNGENLIFRVENSGDNYIHSQLTNMGVIKLHTAGNSSGPAVNLHLTHDIDGATSGTTLEAHRHSGYSAANLYVDGAVSGLENILSSSANIYLTNSLTVDTALTVNGTVYVQGSLLGEEGITLSGGTLTLGGEDDSDLSGYTGTLTVSGGTLNVQSAYSSALSITGGTTNVQADVSSAIDQSGGTLNVQSDMSGSINLSSGTANVKAGVSGGIAISGGTINLSKLDDSDTATHALGSVNVNASSGARMNVQSGLWSVGASTYTAGSLHTYVSAGATLILTGNLTTNGELRMSKAEDPDGGDDIYSQVQLAANTTLTIVKLEDSNTTSGGGIFSLYNGADGDTATLKITNTGNASTVRRITTHEGIILELADNAKQYLAEATLEGDLKLGSGAIMAIQSADGATGKSTVNGTVSGSGTLSVETEVDFGGSMNGASLALTSGTLNLSHTDTTAHTLGSIAITTAGTLNVQSGEWNLAGLSGAAATVNVTGGQLTLGGDLSGIGTLSLTGGKVALGGYGLTVDTLVGATAAANASICLTGYTLGDLGSDALITINTSSSGALTLDLSGFFFEDVGEYTIFGGEFADLMVTLGGSYQLDTGLAISYEDGKIIISSHAEPDKLLTWLASADGIWSAQDTHEDWQDGTGNQVQFSSDEGYTVIFGSAGEGTVHVDGEIVVDAMKVSGTYTFDQDTAGETDSISVTGEDGLAISGSATFDGVDVTVTEGLLLSKSGTLTVTGASTTTASSLSGTGNVTVSGSSELVLTNGGTLTGTLGLLEANATNTLKLGDSLTLNGGFAQDDLWNARTGTMKIVSTAATAINLNVLIDGSSDQFLWGSTEIGSATNRVNLNVTGKTTARSIVFGGRSNEGQHVHIYGDVAINDISLRVYDALDSVIYGNISGNGTLISAGYTNLTVNGGSIGRVLLGVNGSYAGTLTVKDSFETGDLNLWSNSANQYGFIALGADDAEFVVTGAFAFGNANSGTSRLEVKLGDDVSSGKFILKEGGSLTAQSSTEVNLQSAVTLEIATGKTLTMGSNTSLNLKGSNAVTGEVALAGGSVTVSGTGSTMSKLSGTSGALSLAANSGLSIADFSGSLTTLTLNAGSVLTLGASTTSVELGTLNMLGDATLKLTELTQTSGLIFTSIGDISGDGALSIDLNAISLEKGIYKLFGSSTGDLEVLLKNYELATGLSVEYNEMGYIRVFDENAGDMLVWSGEDKMLWNEDPTNTPWDDELAFSSGKDVVFNGTSTGQNEIQVFVGSEATVGNGADIVAGNIVVNSGAYEFVNLNGSFAPFTITADSLTLNDATVLMESNLTVEGVLSGSGELTEYGKLWLKSGGSFNGKILFDVSGAGASSMQIDGDLSVTGLGFNGSQNSVQITMGANLTIANTSASAGLSAGTYEFVNSGEEPVQVVLQTDGDWGIGPVRAGGLSQVNATLTFGEGVSLKKTGSGKLTFDGYGTLGTSIEIAEGTLSLNGSNSVSGSITGAGNLQVVTGTTDNTLTLNGSVDLEGSMILSQWGAKIALGDGVDVTVGELTEDAVLSSGRKRTITGHGDGNLFTINTANEAEVGDLEFTDDITVVMAGAGTQTLRDTQVLGALEVHKGMLKLKGATTVGDLRLSGDHLTVAKGGTLTASSLSLTGAATINLTLSANGTTLNIGTFAANDGSLTLNLTLANFDDYKSTGYQLFIGDSVESMWKTWTGSLKFTTDLDGVRVRTSLNAGEEGWLFFDDLSSTWVWDGGGEWSDDDDGQWTASGSPSGQDVVFSDVDGSPDDVMVSQDGDGVHANSVTVESGDYTFSGGTIHGEGDSDEHNWKVGGTGNDAHATLDTATEGFDHFEVAENGTLTLTENSDLGDGKIIFTGGTVEHNDGDADLSELFDDLDHDGVNHHTDAVKVVLGANEATWSHDNGVAVTLTQGLEKAGAGKLTVDWSTQDATQTYAGITVKDGEVVLTSADNDDATLKLAGGLHGSGDVTLTGDGSYELSGDDSDFGGTLTLVADVAVAGDSTLGGENTKLSLSGGNVSAVAAATVAAGEVQVNAATRLDGEIELTGALKEGGKLTAAEGASITLSGTVSGYTGELATEDDASVKLSGTDVVGEIGNTLSGTGTIVFAGEAAAVQRYDAASANSFILTGSILDSVSLQNDGSVDVIIAGTGNDSIGAIVVNGDGSIFLGDAQYEATWGGAAVQGTGDGSFVLQNGSLTQAITAVTGASLKANVLAGKTVDAAQTALSMFSEVKVAAGGQLQNVTGDVPITDGTQTPSFDLTLDKNNIGEGVAAQRGVITGSASITINNVTQEATKEKFLVNLSNDGLVDAIKAGMRSGEVWLTILQDGTLTIDDSLQNSSFWYYGDTLRLLSYIGAKLTGTDGGSMILNAQHLDVWFVTDDETITSPNEVNDYGELSGSKATVVDEGQSLTVTVDGSETGDNDTTGELQMNNLIGLEDSELNLNNSAADAANDRLNVVFDNSMKVTPDDIEHPENYPTDADGNSVLGMDTVFEGTIHGGGGVDVEKRGQGTLTVGSSDGTKGGLLLDDGNVTLSEGGLVLQGAENKMDSFTFNYDKDDEDNNSGLTLKNGTTTIGEIVEAGDDAANNGVHIEQGAQLVLTGDSELNDTTLSSSDGSGSLSVQGSLSTAAGLDNLATDVSGNLTLTGDATMSNTELTVDKNGTVTLEDNSTMTGGTAHVDGTLDLGSGSHDVGSLSGSGTLKADNGSLELTGTGNEFNGTLAGKGTLDVAAGADLTLSGITTANSTNDAWNLQNSGSLTIDVSGEGAEDVYFDSITTGKGADLTYRFDSDAKDGARLHVGDMDFASDSQFVIESTGAAAVKVGEDGRYVLGQAGSLTGLKQDNVEVKGMAFLHYDPSYVGVDENGNLYVQLAESKVNKFFSDGMEKNSRAGADMFWNASNPNSANWQRITGDFLYALFYSDLYRTVNELYNLKSQGKEAEMAKALAAGAGASTSVLGAALSQDIKRQLGAIRNRTTTMGSEPKYDTYDEAPFYHMWINGEGSVHKMDASGMAPGYSLNSWGGTVGVDLDLSATTTVGFALTAMYGDLKADAADSARGDMDTTYVTAFARVADGAWIHTFVVAGGRADVSLNRTVTVGDHTYSAKGSTDGYTLGALYELGYTAVMNAEGTFALQSVFNVEFRHAALSGYTETGSDAGLKVGDISHNVLTFGAGVRAQAVVGENAYNRTSILEGRMLVKADAGDRSGVVNNALINGDGTTRELESAKVGMIGLEIGAGLSIPLGSDSGTIFIDASLEVRSGYTGMDANVGYRINF